MFRYLTRSPVDDVLHSETFSAAVFSTEKEQMLKAEDSAADLTGGHSCSGRRGPWDAGPWRSLEAKFWFAIAKS